MMRGILAMMLMMAMWTMATGCNKVDKSREICRKILLMPKVDSLTMVAMVSELDTLMSPEVFGRDFAMEAICVIECDTTNINEGEWNLRIGMLRDILAEKGTERHSSLFAEGVQSKIDELPIDRRMRLYAKISTPAQLGTAMRIDKYRNVTDSVQAVEMINILRLIYTEEEMNVFMKCFNR